MCPPSPWPAPGRKDPPRPPSPPQTFHVLRSQPALPWRSARVLVTLRPPSLGRPASLPGLPPCLVHPCLGQGGAFRQQTPQDQLQTSRGQLHNTPAHVNTKACLCKPGPNNLALLTRALGRAEPQMGSKSFHDLGLVGGQGRGHTGHVSSHKTS